MTMSDPIADMLTRIRNANTAKTRHSRCTIIQDETCYRRYPFKRRLYRKI